MVASSAALSIAILRDSSVDGKSQAAERLVAIAGRTSGGRMGEETARVEEILSQVRQQGDTAGKRRGIENRERRALRHPVSARDRHRTQTDDQ